MSQNIWTAFVAKTGNKILVDSSSDGRTWTGSRYFNQTSQNTPALAFYGGKLYLAYITDDAPSDTLIPSNRIFVCITSDGLCWAPTIFTGYHSKCAPALAVFGDSLYVAFIEYDPANGISNNRILYGSFTQATHWVPAKDTGHFSPQSPALIEYGGNLHMVYISNDGKNAILHCEMSPDGRWGPSSDTGLSTRVPPAIAVFNKGLYVAFVANDSTDTVLISPASDWSATTNIKQAASSGPSLAVFNDGKKLVVGFPGKSSAECLLTSSSNPSSWPSSATDIRQRSQLGSGMALAIAPFASGPQPPPSLSCTLAGSSGPRVYYRDQTGLLREVVVANGNAQLTPPWTKPNQPGSSQYPAACGGGISCLYISDVGARVYYPDPNNNIIELSLHQDDGSFKFTKCQEISDPHSPLSCLQAGSSGTRVYYMATKNRETQVYEVPFLSDVGGPSPDPTSFSPTALGMRVTPVAAHPNSPLTSQYIPNIGSRVYYKDPNNQIIELQLNYIEPSQLPPEGLIASFNPTGYLAAAGGLTCLLAGSGGMRVYFLAKSESNGLTFVNELTIINGVENVTPLPPSPIAARPGSPLTCLYIPGVGSRVYYISNEDDQVCEWALPGGYTRCPLSKAADDSPLTCLYIGGSGSRVYYVRKEDGNVQELAWLGSGPEVTNVSFSM